MEDNNLFSPEKIENLHDLLSNPHKTFEFFNIFVDKIESLNKYKDQLTEKELHTSYTKINKEYLYFRESLKWLIVEYGDLYYQKHYDYCKENFLYYLLLDGYSYDIQKTTDKDPLMAFIPYNHQLPLIEGMMNDETLIMVEKARRQGASKIFIHFMVWLLIFGSNEVMYATHKDLNSLDMKNDTGHNSTFDNVRWLLDKSLFVDREWRDGKMGGFTCQKQINLNGNILIGAVLGKGTAVGMAGTRIFVDEIDVVCDMYPNQANQFIGSFSQSVTHVYLYSTYRSMSYPFYKLKANKEPGWTFYRLDWRDNPTCNEAWYKAAKSKMGNDEKLIARELDIDPTKVRDGSIFSLHIKDSNYYTKLDTTGLTKVIGGDFGGGSSLTSFILGYVNLKTGKLYLDDIVESTQYDHIKIRDEFLKRGYEGIKVYADRSASSQIGAKGHDWKTLLSKVGVKLIPINNNSIYYVHALMNEQFDLNNILVNKNNLLLVERLTGYRYVNDSVAKDANSHFGDACSYLYRGLFMKNSEISFY